MINIQLEKRKFDLEDRLVEFTCRMIDDVEELIAIVAKSITTAKNNNEVNKLRIDH